MDPLRSRAPRRARAGQAQFGGERVVILLAESLVGAFMALARCSSGVDKSTTYWEDAFGNPDNPRTRTLVGKKLSPSSLSPGESEVNDAIHTHIL